MRWDAGPDATIYHVEIANVATLESNSPVLINDVVVGSVGQDDGRQLACRRRDLGQARRRRARQRGRHRRADQPAGVDAPGAQPAARSAAERPAAAGFHHPAERSRRPIRRPRQTLASLSAVVNGGGLGQIGDIIHNFSTALSGREPEIRDLLTRLDDFVGVLDRQRDNIVASIQQLNRLAGTFAGQRDVIDRALKDIPPALDVLIKERPQLTTALEKLGTFSDTATRLVNDAAADLVTNLKNLEPTLKALADVGPDLQPALICATAFPYGRTSSTVRSAVTTSTCSRSST